jgi:hypothetical protein
MKYIFKLFSFVILCNSPLIAQVQKDAVFWGTIGFDKKINETFSIQSLSQLSFNQNFRELNSAFIDVGLSARVSKAWTLGVNYRFAEWMNLDNIYMPINRIYFDAASLKSFNHQILQYRFRCQNQIYDLTIFDPYKNEKLIIRNKLFYKWNLDRKYALFCSFEHFFRLNQMYRTQTTRTEVGFTLKQDLHNRINFYFINQMTYFTKYPRVDFIYGITYNYKF